MFQQRKYLEIIIVSMKQISREIRNYESSHQEKFQDFSSKIMRELGQFDKSSSQFISFKERNVPDSPTKMDSAILKATRDYEIMGKEKEKQIRPKIDKIKKDQEVRLVVG